MTADVRPGGAAATRRLGFGALTLFGMTFMVPMAPTAVYGFISDETAGAVPLVYLLGCLGLGLTALSYRVMAREVPVGGSVYSYVGRGLGPRAGFVAGWLLLADYVLLPGLVFTLTSVYVRELVPALPQWVVVVGTMGLTTVAAVRRIRLTAWITAALFWVQILGLAVFAVPAGVHLVRTGGAAAWPAFVGDTPSPGLLAAGLAIGTLSFLGFDAISSLAEDARNPERDVGNAIVAALAVMGVLFVGLTYLTALVEAPDNSGDPPLRFFAIARDVGGPTLATGLVVLSLVAVVGNVLLPQAAVARVVAVMARGGRLPWSRQLATIDTGTGVPVVATLTVTAVALLVALFLPLPTTIALVNCGALSAFLLLNLAVPVRFLRRGPRSAAAVVRYGLLPLGGACVVGYVLLSYPLGTYVTVASWLLVGGLLTVMSRRERRLGRDLADAERRSIASDGDSLSALDCSAEWLDSGWRKALPTSRAAEEIAMVDAAHVSTAPSPRLLTPDNCVALFVDFQPQMFFATASEQRELIMNSSLGLARATNVFQVPVVLSTVSAEGFAGPVMGELADVLGKAEVIDRTTMNAWEDERVVAAVKETGRSKIVIAGLWTEVCVVMPVLCALDQGYEVYVAADACGGVSRQAHDHAMERMRAAGATPVTWLQVLLELQRDWARPATYGGVMDVVKAHGGAYGQGVVYADRFVGAHSG